MKFLNLLKKTATKSNHWQHKMSCIIAEKNKVLSIGHNSLKTSPKSNTPFKCIHAETSAILKLKGKNIENSTAYIYRAHKNGNMAIARPCNSCYNMLKAQGVKKIVYTTETGIKEENL